MVSLFPKAPLCSPFVMKNSPIPELCSAWSTAQLGLTFCDPKDCSPPGSSVHGDSPGKNTGMGCHALLQGIFSTQGLNPDFLHCRQILYWLSHQGSIHSMNAGVGSPSLLQGIFLTQELNQGLLQCRQILFFFFKFIYFNWRLTTLQYCGDFCHTLTWISHGCTCVPPSWTALPPPSQSHPSGLSQCTGFECPVSCIELGLVTYFTYGNIYMFQCYSLKSSHPYLLPLSPKVCSLYLCLFCCLAYRVIVTIFLNSIYMH